MFSRIRLYNEESSSQSWELPLSNPIIVGRSPECDVCFGFPSVSRLQFKVFADENGVVYIENLSNSNITRLNDEEITGVHKLSKGDKIKFSKFIFGMELINNQAPDEAATMFL